MVTKTSTALIAAIFTIAGGAGMSFAQTTNETSPPQAPAATAAETAGQAVDAAQDAAKAAADAATDAAKAAENAAGEAAGAAAEAASNAADSAADAAATAADAAAQAATGTAPAETAAPAATTEAPAASANGEQSAGQSYIKETFGDWQMRCIRTADNKDPCELYQLLKDAQGGAVAEASLVPVKGQVSAIVTYVAPLETDLQQGLRLKIDNNAEQGYPFMVCAQIGCISRVGLSDADLNIYKRGNTGSVTLHPFGAPQEQNVKLTLSLKGFTAGLEAVQKSMAELETATPAAPAPAAAPAAQ